MSHFVVAVIVPGAKVGQPIDVQSLVGPMLQPYHEYECTGIEDEYVVDVDETDEVMADYEKYKGEGQSFDTYATKEGYTVRDGKAFRRTNPNAKWDWWVVGGRWSGIMVDKQGGSHNYLRAKDFDFVARFEKEIARQGRYYDDIHAALAEHRGTKTWAEVRDAHPDDIDAARKEYHEQPGIVAARAVERFDATDEEKADKFDGGKVLGIFGSVDDWIGDKELVVRRRAFGQIGFFAMLDQDGWHEKGSMGWFGCVSDDENQDDYVEGAIQKLLGLDDDDLIVAVDCHI